MKRRIGVRREARKRISKKVGVGEENIVDNNHA